MARVRNIGITLVITVTKRLSGAET